MSELEIQQRVARVCDDKILDKELTSQDYTLRILIYGWLVTGGWMPPKKEG